MPVVMPPVVPPVIAIGIGGLGDGMHHNACGDDGTDHDGGDHRPIGAARGWGRNGASRDDRCRTQSQERFPHRILHVNHYLCGRMAVQRFDKDQSIKVLLGTIYAI